MGTVLDLLKPEIEKTVTAWILKRFDPDPIAGAAFFKNHQCYEFRLQAAWIYFGTRNSGRVVICQPGADQMQAGEVVARGLSRSACDASKMLDGVEEALDEMRSA